MSKPVKKTRLHDWHINRGANMAIFGSYDMPLWDPSGAKEEHLVVLTHAGNDYRQRTRVALRNQP